MEYCRLFELRCHLSLLASFFFQQLEVEIFWRLNSGSLFCKKVYLLDIVLTVSGTGAGVSWVSFNIRIQSRGIALHNARYFRKLEDFRENLLLNTLSKFGFGEVVSVFTRSMFYIPYGKTILVTVIVMYSRRLLFLV